MATFAFPCIALCSSRFFNSQENFTFAIPSSSSSSSHASSPLFSSSLRGSAAAIFLRRERCRPRTSSERGIPAELAEESQFVPLNNDESIYGPPILHIHVSDTKRKYPMQALLLVGFEADEMEKIQMFLKELDGEFLKVIYCTEDMINNSVWDAMHTEHINVEDAEIAVSLPRICILSGLSGEEMIMFIDAFPETGLKPAVFAALVPNSANKLLGEVIEEIMGDHEMLGSKFDPQKKCNLNGLSGASKSPLITDKLLNTKGHFGISSYFLT